MSRPSRSNNTSTNSKPLTINTLPTSTNSSGGSGPPSHPSEQVPEHRSFLVRSLERSDVDLAALMEVNESLHLVKKAIVEHERGGALVLLQLGQGLIALDAEAEEDCLAFQTGGGSAGGSECYLPESLLADEHLQQLCVDFLLRLKLRRKLLNRLSRRLKRVAHAMDGNDVAPPGPPRYGDLRLHVDPTEVQAFAELFARQEQAIRTMELQREDKQHDLIKERFMSEEDQKEENESEAAATASTPAVPPAAPDESSPSATEDAPAHEVSDPPQSKLLHEADNDNAAGASSQTNMVTATTIPTPDYELLKSYDDAYEKRIVDPSAGTFKYTMITDRRMDMEEEDYVKIRYGAGIGATHRSMSAKEKEAEFLRWQTSLLSRIPDQPTFADTGMEHCVFLLEERRRWAQALLVKKKEEEERHKKEQVEKRQHDDDDNERKKLDDENMGLVKEEEDEAAVDVKAAEAVCKKSMVENDEKVNDESSKREKEPDDDKSDDESKSSDDNKSDGEDGYEGKKNSSPSKEDAKEGEEQQEEAVVVKKVRPISLAAVPSFYEQDLKRIKLIHQELMAASMHDHARKRFEEVTKAYNTALRHSNELNSRRDQIERSLQNLLYQSRSQWDDQKMKNDTAKDNWLRAKRNFESEELSKMLPSRWGKRPAGTVETQRYGSRTDAASQHVAHCLADIVDSVELITLGQLPKLRKYPYPCPEDDNAHAEALQDMEARLRQELSGVNAKFRQSEEERNRAWRKMLKTKAEFDLPHHSSVAVPGYPLGAARSRVPLNMTNYHQLPLPNLRMSMTESVPQEVATARPALASYIPQRSHVSASSRPSSDSRYSAARVKERIASDGTVAPVSEPKRSKDGLFLRPAGRTRKGMEWDAVRGIWVPAESLRGTIASP